MNAEAHIQEAFKKYLEVVRVKLENSIHKGYLVEVAEGSKNWKVITYDQPPNDKHTRSVHSFVRKSDGAILKAGTWKAPARNGERGSIVAEDNGASCVDWHGCKYLK